MRVYSFSGYENGNGKGDFFFGLELGVGKALVIQMDLALRLNPFSQLINTLLAMEKGKLFCLTNI